MKTNNFLLNIFLIQFFFTSLIHSHGFGSYVYVKSTNGWRLAGQMKCRQTVVSYDLKTRHYVTSRIKAKGCSITNCYFKIGLNNSAPDDIQCTPSQVFYVPAIDQWIPAYRLKVGDHLLNDQGYCVPITHIEFVRSRLPVCTFEIKNTHTFFVGSQSVLTHNMLVPFSFVGLSMAFGSGAATGGTAGTFFGPITLVGGVVIGGIAGAIIYSCQSRSSFTYKLQYDPEAISYHLSENHNQSNSQKNDAPRLMQGNPLPDDPNEDKNRKMNSRVAEEEARKLGFEKTNYYSQGQPVFKKCNKFITPDQTSHNGGVWKMADSVKNLARKVTRMGTYDKFLNRIGD